MVTFVWFTVLCVLADIPHPPLLASLSPRGTKEEFKQICMEGEQNYISEKENYLHNWPDGNSKK